MKLAVFGASGRTGRLVIMRALHDGHQVTAFTRSPRKLADLRHDRLTVIAAELSDAPAVDRAVFDVDAVVSALGAGVRPRGTELSQGVSGIVAAMGRRGVRRLVVLSTASVADEADLPDLRTAWLVACIRIVFRRAYSETVRIGEVVRSSDTDWTLVRVGLLDDRAAQSVRVGHYGRHEVGVLVSRTSVAHYLLALALCSDHLCETISISN